MKKNKLAVQIGANILYARQHEGWSQTVVEQESGIPKARLSRYENGHVVPSVRTLMRLASAFNVPIMDMLDGLE